jgi:hypothetical protein
MTSGWKRTAAGSLIKGINPLLVQYRTVEIGTERYCATSWDFQSGWVSIDLASCGL